MQRHCRCRVKYAVITEGMFKAIQITNTMRKNTYLPHMAVEASCVSLETPKQKLCDFQSAVFPETEFGPALEVCS